MAEDEDTLEAEIVYPITCGDSKANLIWRKFVCPGINVKCVQVRVMGCDTVTRAGSMPDVLPNEGFEPSRDSTAALHAFFSVWSLSVSFGKFFLHHNHVMVGEGEITGTLIPVGLTKLSRPGWRDPTWLERCCPNLTALLENLGTSLSVRFERNRGFVEKLIKHCMVAPLSWRIHG